MTLTTLQVQEIFSPVTVRQWETRSGLLDLVIFFLMIWKKLTAEHGWTCDKEWLEKNKPYKERISRLHTSCMERKGTGNRQGQVILSMVRMKLAHKRSGLTVKEITSTAFSSSWACLASWNTSFYSMSVSLRILLLISVYLSGLC